MSENRALSLSELQNELSHWRSHRQPRSIPLVIREQAVRLLKQHRPCEIKAALNINHRTLKQWKQECSESGAEQWHEPSTSFISLPVLPPQSVATSLLPSPMAKITRHAGDGSSVIVEGSLSLEPVTVKVLVASK